jgi:hypothetical protein
VYLKSFDKSQEFSTPEQAKGFIKIYSENSFPGTAQQGVDLSLLDQG